MLFDLFTRVYFTVYDINRQTRIMFESAAKRLQKTTRAQYEQLFEFVARNSVIISGKTKDNLNSFLNCSFGRLKGLLASLICFLFISSFNLKIIIHILLHIFLIILLVNQPVFYVFYLI